MPSRIDAAVVALLAAVAAFPGACAKPRASPMTLPAADVELETGTVAVNTTVDARQCRDDSGCAQSEALRMLLFTGVPGSRVPRPMVADESAARTKHGAFLNELFEKGGYRRYVVSTARGSAPPGTAGDTRTWTIVVNVDALRATLERQGIVRRFGY
jgi:hypothetical protein